MRVLLAALAMAPLAAGCRANNRHGEPVSGQKTASASVRPGINDNFLDVNLDAERYIERFEVESREIYTERHDIVNALRLRPGMDVVDIGAGTGLFAEPFARGVGPSGRVYAIDIAPAFVEHIRARAESMGLKNVEARVCPEDSVGLPPRSVDLAFVCDTYHHFEYPHATLASIYQAVRPGGELVVIDFIREPGVSREWILNHVRGGKNDFRREIEQAGFVFVEDVTITGFKENYYLRFRRP